MLKRIGEQARRDIEAMIGSKVYLRLWVQIRKNWSKDEKMVRRFGY
jgi:GTP-binding protein Era